MAELVQMATIKSFCRRLLLVLLGGNPRQKTVKMAVLTCILCVFFVALGGFQLENYLNLRGASIAAEQYVCHIFYALQWFTLSIVLMIVFLIVSSRLRRQAKAQFRR